MFTVKVMTMAAFVGYIITAAVMKYITSKGGNTGVRTASEARHAHRVVMSPASPVHQ